MPALALRYLVNFLALYLGCALCCLLRTGWNWSPILAAAFLGVAVTFVPVPARFDKKRLQIVFCTGTFVGMSSGQIISGPAQILEVSLLGAALCVVAEPYYKGLGGRMGFIAFLGHDDLAAHEDLGMNVLTVLLGTILASLLGTHATYWLTHRRSMNSVRAASLSSLVFVILAQTSHWPFLLALQPAFFGSTYVAMSEPVRLSEKRVLLAGLVFALILFGLEQVDFLHFRGGVGGTLGGTAFVACICVYWLQWAELHFMASGRGPRRTP